MPSPQSNTAAVAKGAAAGARKKILAIALPAVLALGAGGYYVYAASAKLPSLLPDEETMRAERERMRNATPEERQAFREERRARMEAMTPEQHRQMREEMRARMQERQRRELKEYFEQDEAGRKLLLDQRIDAMLAMANRRREGGAGGPGGPGGFGGFGPPPGGRGGERPAAPPAAGANANTNADGPQNTPANAGQQPRRTPPTQEQRNNRMRERLENSTPLERAQRERYMADMRARANERGVSMPGPGGGRGPR